MSGPASHANELVARNTLEGVPSKAVNIPRRFGQPFNQPLQDWRGKRVWLVGASSGIGLACAQALQAAGAHVVISARELGALSEWARQSESEGKRLELYPLDVTDSLQVKYVTRQVAAQGTIDMLLYCAGHYRAQRATDFDLPDMLRHQEVNYNGLLRVLGEALPLMLQLGFGLSPLASGTLTVATAVGALGTRVVMTQTIRRFGFRQLLIGATVLSSLFYMGTASSRQARRTCCCLWC